MTVAAMVIMGGESASAGCSNEDGMAAAQRSRFVFYDWCRGCGGKVRIGPICDLPQGSGTFADPRPGQAANINEAGRESYRKGDYESALSLFQQACQIYPADYCQRNIALAREAIARRAINAIFDQALTVHRAGDYAGAIAAWDRVLALDPSNGAARNNRVIAVDAADLARKSATFNEALAAHRAGDYARAVELWDRTLALDPNNAVARENRNKALASKQDAAEQAEIARALPGVIARVLDGDALLQSRAVLGSLLFTRDARCPYDTGSNCAGLAALPNEPATPKAKRVEFDFAPPAKENPAMRKMHSEILDLRKEEEKLALRLQKEKDPIKVISLRPALESAAQRRQQRETDYVEENRRVNHGIRSGS
ncbi:MAG: tetratricopeptide repeat protein [Alphaproteobacteria bacterium]